jgi:hypothetical protein
MASQRKKKSVQEKRATRVSAEPQKLALDTTQEEEAQRGERRSSSLGDLSLGDLVAEACLDLALEEYVDDPGGLDVQQRLEGYVGLDGGTRLVGDLDFTVLVIHVGDTPEPPDPPPVINEKNMRKRITQLKLDNRDHAGSLIARAGEFSKIQAALAELEVKEEAEEESSSAIKRTAPLGSHISRLEVALAAEATVKLTLEHAATKAIRSKTRSTLLEGANNGALFQVLKNAFRSPKVEVEAGGKAARPLGTVGKATSSSSTGAKGKLAAAPATHSPQPPLAPAPRREGPRQEKLRAQRQKHRQLRPLRGTRSPSPLEVDGGPIVLPPPRAPTVSFPTWKPCTPQVAPPEGFLLDRGPSPFRAYRDVPRPVLLASPQVQLPALPRPGAGASSQVVLAYTVYNRASPVPGPSAGRGGQGHGSSSPAVKRLAPKESTDVAPLPPLRKTTEKEEDLDQWRQKIAGSILRYARVCDVPPSLLPRTGSMALA